MHDAETSNRKLTTQVREYEERHTSLLREQDVLKGNAYEQARLHEQSKAECRRLEGLLDSLERELDLVRQQSLEWESKFSDADMKRYILPVVGTCQSILFC